MGKRHMRIIACDDDRNMLQLIQQWTDEILREQPHQFISYESGIDLLKEMERYEGEFFMMISIMPRVRQEK